MFGIDKQTKFYNNKAIEIKNALKEVKHARKMAIMPIYSIRLKRVYMNMIDLRHTYFHV